MRFKAEPISALTDRDALIDLWDVDSFSDGAPTPESRSAWM